jgi:hypothetical protein
VKATLSNDLWLSTQAVLRSRSRWSGNFLLEPEPKFFLPGSGAGAGYINFCENFKKA